MKKTYRIGIIGAGFSGSVAAFYLKQLGHEISVFEKNTSIFSSNKLLNLNPMAFDLIKNVFGLGSFFETLSSKYDHILFSNIPSPNTITKSTTQVRKIILDNAYGYGVNRIHLLRELHSKIPRERIHYGAEITRWEEYGNGNVSCTDIVGRRFGPFDIIMVATGSDSFLSQRDNSWIFPNFWNPPKIIQKKGLLLSFTAFDIEKKYQKSVFNFFLQKHGWIRITPLKGFLNNSLVSLANIEWYISENDILFWWNNKCKEWRKDIISNLAFISEILAQIVSPDQINSRQLQQIRFSNLNIPTIKYIGSAAYQTFPFIDITSSLTIYDIFNFGRQLEISESASQAIVSSYENSKRKIYNYQSIARLLVPIYTMNSRFINNSSHFIFTLVRKIKFISNFILKVISGYW